ncbi:MAG: PHP domain-containing protein [Symbiobacteriia bacterium]
MSDKPAAHDAGLRGGLLLDLHSHSLYSGDSRLLPREMVRLARERGLNGIAVTDHETVQGGLEARAANDDPCFLVIPGVEYATEYGHVVGLFLERELDGLPVRRHPAEHMRVPFQQVVKAIHAQGGLAVLAHPYQNRLTLPDAPFGGAAASAAGAVAVAGLGTSAEPGAGPERVDAIEGFNARAAAVRNPQANDLALAFAQAHGIPAVGGSDAHSAAEIGRGRTRVEGVEPGADLAVVKEAIRVGRVTPSGVNSPRTVIPLSAATRMWTSKRWRRAPTVFLRLLLTSLGRPGLWLENVLRGPLRDPNPRP